jgi:hypothetical protein
VIGPSAAREVARQHVVGMMDDVNDFDIRRHLLDSLIRIAVRMMTRAGICWTH